jgi:hypothetical protein
MAAGNTYVAIATNTLASTASSVTFSSIPATYTDLVAVVNASVTAGGVNLCLNMNGDTTATYSETYMTGDGSNATGERLHSTETTFKIPYYGYMTSSPSVYIINVMNYANTTTYKTILARANNAANGLSAMVGLWRATPAAINQLVFTTASSTFTVGSTFTLYGIAAA